MYVRTYNCSDDFRDLLLITGNVTTYQSSMKL